jgi:hypothetical protein
MAILANTFTTFAVKGMREDLSDVIANIAPEDTPFMSNLGKGPKPGNTFFEWQQDTLAAADNTNAQLEGDDISAFDAVAPTVRVGNYCQISRKTLILSETEQEVDKAGRDDEEAYQLAKKVLSSSATSRRFSSAPTSSVSPVARSTARKTAALLSWVRTNVDKARVVRTRRLRRRSLAWSYGHGTTRAFTEALLKNVIQLQWVQGGTATPIMVDGVQKQTMSTFAGIATKTISQTREAGDGHRRGRLLRVGLRHVLDRSEPVPASP